MVYFYHLFVYGGINTQHKAFPSAHSFIWFGIVGLV